MTNAEYEKLCVDSARKTTREVAEQAVANIDEKIKDAEKALALLHEARRELVNRYDLNRCSHIPDWDIHGECFCVDCGETL